MLKSKKHFLFLLLISTFLYTCRQTESATYSIETPEPPDNKYSKEKVALGRMLFLTLDFQMTTLFLVLLVTIPHLPLPIDLKKAKV